jgi:uncharacterized RDD family membrane protein YckC
LEEKMYDVSPGSTEPEVVSGDSEYDQVSSGKKVCSACRTVNEPAAVYCYKCGVRLPDEIQFGAESIGPPAGFWIRFVAHLVDQLFLGIIGFVISIIFATFLVDTSLNGALYFEFTDVPLFMWWTLGITVALEVLYFTVAIGAWGRTIGKAMLGIKVVRRNGTRVSYARSLARCLLYLIQLELIIGLTFLVIAFNSEKQGIHDMICDTGVVKV